MKARPDPIRVAGKAKPKASRTSRAGKPRKAPAKSPPKAGAKPDSIPARDVEPASVLIDARIRDLAGWRGATLARMRALILKADPGISEEWKWSNPVWSHHGIVCTGEAYTKAVKLTFAQGAKLLDPSRLFNSSLEGNTRRAIDIHEGEKLDAGAFQALVRAAVAQNAPTANPRSKAPPGPARMAGAAKPKAMGRSRASNPRESATKSRSKAGAKAESGASKAKPIQVPKRRKVVLLSGGNPQIAKADGDAPVQAYIAALPGWKRDLGKRLDALVVRCVPVVRKAVKWNSPLYGIEGQGWFLGVHAFARYLKLAFFRGSSLRPLPPGASKDPHTRYVDIHEGDALDEAQMSKWLRQAAALPGWNPGRPS